MESKKKYYGKMCADKTILWVGPMTKDEMKSGFDIFRHNISGVKPKYGKHISREDAAKVMDEYYS